MSSMIRTINEPQATMDYLGPTEPGRRGRPRGRGSAVQSVLVHGVLVVLAVACLVPFVWLVCASLKNKDDFFTYTFLSKEHFTTLRWEDGALRVKGEVRWEDGAPRRLKGEPVFQNYTLLFRRHRFAQWMVNSLFITAAHTAIVVTLSSLGGFALAKYRFAGRKVLMVVMLITMLLPSQVLLPSAWLLMYHIGWLNSYLALIVPGAVSVFGMFLFMQAMRGVPDELLQAGRVDGCSELRLWWELALPIVRPMIGAYTLLSFMATWNSFLWPQVVLQSADKYTLPIGLANMIGLPAYDTPLGMLMAGTLLAILPVVVLFFILQRDFIAGLTSGAVKG